MDVYLGMETNHALEPITVVKVHASLEELALGRFPLVDIEWVQGWPDLIELRVFTMVDGKEMETRTRVTTQMLSDVAYIQANLSDTVLRSIRKAI